jgi:hypothetical protein
MAPEGSVRAAINQACAPPTGPRNKRWLALLCANQKPPSTEARGAWPNKFLIPDHHTSHLAEVRSASLSARDLQVKLRHRIRPLALFGATFGAAMVMPAVSTCRVASMVQPGANAHNAPQPKIDTTTPARIGRGRRLLFGPGAW